MSQSGVWGQSPQPLGDFLQVFGKYSYHNAIRITFRTFLEPFERSKLLRFETQFKKKLSLLQIKFKTRLKSCIFG